MTPCNVSITLYIKGMMIGFWTFTVGARKVVAPADTKHRGYLLNPVLPAVFPTENVSCRPACGSEQGAYQIVNRLFPTDEPLVLDA